jgi:hypothetical protein
LSAPEPRDFEIKRTEHASLIERRTLTSVEEIKMGQGFSDLYAQNANFITRAVE